MKLPDFKVEQWMNDYEHKAVYNMTDTCVKALSFKELCNLEKINLDNIVLDYGEITGNIEFKKEILKLYTTGTISNITLAQGCLQANELVMHTLLETNEEVIVCVPGYQQFIDVPKSLGCKVHEIKLEERDNWKPNIHLFKKCINEHTKMIILNNPNNPTGTEYSKNFLNELVELCNFYHIYILCDEVYRGLNNEVSISDIYEYGISTSSLSKIYSLAGLRIGWIKANTEVIHNINVRRDYSIISTGPLVDYLGYIALKHKDILQKRSKDIVSKNKEIVQEWLKDNPHFSVVIPSGGTVSFLKYDFDIDSITFAKDLLEEGIFFVPGSCFDLEYHFRLGLAQDSKMIQEGLNKLSKYVQTRVI